MKLTPIVLAAGIALGLGFLLGHKGQNPSIPTIVTHYDTVTTTELKHDTEFVVKLKHDTVYKTNIVEKVVTAPPETVHVFHPLSGVTGLLAGQHFGDTTKVISF